MFPLTRVVQATADTGNFFVKWTGTSVGARATNDSCSFPLRGNVTVTPNFRAATTVTLLKDGNGQGTVAAKGTLSPTAPVCGSACSSTDFAALDGKPVTLLAMPSLGSRLLAYSGDCTSNSSSCTFIPSGGNDTVTATFALQQFLLTVTDRVNGSVTGTTDAGTIDCGVSGDDCTETLDFATGVSLEAAQNPDAIFVNWTGDVVCAGKKSTLCSFAMPNRNVTVTPNYRARTFVTLLKSGDGRGTVSAAGTLSPTGPVCGLTCSSTGFAALDGKLVTLRAAPSVGSRLVNFSGDCASNSSTCTFIPTGANETVTATFVLQQFALNVTNRANGSVTGSTTLGTIVTCGDAGGDCSETVSFGDVVTLVADPLDGHTFVNWTGDAVCAGKTNATCPFKMPLRNVSATPNYRRATLVTVTNDGQGRITGTGFNCSSIVGVTGTDCSEKILDGRAIALTATPATGWSFALWDDPNCGGFNTSSCSFTPTGDTGFVTALYARQPRVATLNIAGNGSVTSGLFGCDTASSPCEFPGLFGDEVVFTAAADAGHQLISWAGCTSTNGSVCTLTLNANRTVTATFQPIPAATVTVGPAGGFTTFSASAVTIQAGQTVQWNWASSPHNVVSGNVTTGAPDGEFCSPGDVNCATTPLLGAGTTYSHTFTTPGTFTYFCRQHRGSGMTGTVTVTPAE